MKFKKGDKVKSVSDETADISIGHTYVLTHDENLGIKRDAEQYIKEDSMSKYDELKSRIENVEGWDKEADDILQEIFKPMNIRGPIITVGMNTISVGCTSEAGYINVSLNNPIIEEKFNYSSQCEKLGAFKQALTRLLDHSNIKKDIVGTEVKADIEGKTYKVRILEKL